MEILNKFKLSVNDYETNKCFFTIQLWKLLVIFELSNQKDFEAFVNIVIIGLKQSVLYTTCIKYLLDLKNQMYNV